MNNTNPFIASRPYFLDGIGPSHSFYSRTVSSTNLCSNERQAYAFQHPVTEGSTYSEIMRHCFLDLKQSLYFGLKSYCTNVAFNKALQSKRDFAIGLELECEAREPRVCQYLYGFTNSRRGSLNPAGLSPIQRRASLDELFNGSQCLRRPDLEPGDPLISNWLYCRSDGSLASGLGVEVTTIPLGEKYCLNPHLYEGLTTLLSSRGYVSQGTSRTGLHVHVNRGFFSDISNIREAIDPVSSTQHPTRNRLLDLARVELIEAAIILLFEEMTTCTLPLLKSVFRRIPEGYCKSFELYSTGYAFRHRSSTQEIFKNVLSTLHRLFSTTTKIQQIDDPLLKTIPALTSNNIALADTIKNFINKNSWVGCIDPNNPRKWLIEFRSYFAEHSRVVNVSPANTIEFRLGSGTLDPWAIYNNVAFIYAVCSFIRRKAHNPAALAAQLCRDMEADRLAENVFAVTPYHMAGSLLKDFLIFASNKAITPALRGVCLASLYGNQLQADSLRRPITDTHYKYVCGLQQ